MSLASKLAGCVERLKSPFAGERAAAESRIRAICARSGLNPVAYGLGDAARATSLDRASAASRYLKWAWVNTDPDQDWQANGANCWTRKPAPNAFGIPATHLAVDDAGIVAMAERDIGGAAEFDRWIAFGMRTPARYADAFRSGEPA